MALKHQLTLLQRQKKFWLILALFSTIIVANSISLFHSVNALFYSQLAHLTQSQQSEVVLIESEHLSREHTDLIKQLQTYEPSHIIVVSNERLQLNTNVIKDNQETVFYPHPNNDYCLPSLNDWAGYNIELKYSDKHRCNSIWPMLFESDDTAALINFELSPAALPKFSAARLMAMDIMASQLQNRIIILGQKNAGLGVSLNAPKLSQSTNYLLLVAYIADTLQKEQAIFIVNKWQSTLLFLLLSIALLFAFQKLSSIYSLILATSLSVTWFGLSYLMLISQQIYLPVGQMIILTFYTLLWVIIVRKLNEEYELVNLIGDIQQKMIGRYLPQSFTSQSSPWDSITRLINQQLALNKSIFLARKEGDHRLTEIKAINCQLSDIQEMRRDYKRPPYSDALKAFNVIVIERPFFEGLDEGEIQYIVPLTYAGDVRGFWAMTITPDERFNQQAFEKNVNAFAGQVGELLFHHRIYESQTIANNSSLSRFLTMTLQEPLSQKVKTSITEMEQKLTTLEHVFNHIRSATVLFNLFGQVVQINKALEELASHHQFSIFDMTALDLLCQITNLDIETAKGKLRYITLQKGEIYLEAKLDTQVYVLNVRAVDSASIQSASGEPFQVSGILFEFIDIALLIGKMPSKQLCDFLNEQQPLTKDLME